MNDQPIHNLYLHFQELPISMRVLYTGALLVLGLGYMFALLYVYTANGELDGKPGLSVDDIVIAYSGTSEGTRLETALRGPMSSMLSQTDLVSMLSWVQAGAGRGSYEAQIRPIIEKNCLSCHDGSNPHLTNLDGFDNIQSVVEMDTGPDMFTLVRVSHIHLFGITFIFFLMGLIFSHAFFRPVWLKCVIMATPFASIVSDVSSWYSVQPVCLGGVGQRCADGTVLRHHVGRFDVANLVLSRPRLGRCEKHRNETIDRVIKASRCP